jgi:hypothetical protein
MVLIVVVNGCRPSIHEVVKVISNIPIGTNREEMRKILLKAYPNDLQSFDLVRPPLAMTELMIQDEKNTIAFHKRGNTFVYVYPPNLYDKLPSKTLYDMLGIIKEASEGDGSLSIIYDSNTNYIGFSAFSSEEVK